MGRWTKPFQALTGSVLGRDHARVGRNNQDGYALRCAEQGIVAAVTDGCSAGRYSEVGARLGASFLAERGLRMLQRTGRLDDRFAEQLTGELLGYLRQLARGPKHGGPEHAAFVQDHLLFGFLCLVLSGHHALLFGIGDGVFSIDGRVTVLDPGADNAPRYLAYALLSPTALVTRPTSAAPDIHLAAPSRTLDSILIGTDGLTDLIATRDEPLRSGRLQGGIDGLERDPLFDRNPSLLQKRLNEIGEVNKRLRDDTTVVLVRRSEAGQRWTS